VVSKPLSVAVYCGSRHGTDERFSQIARAVGAWIGSNNAQLVYGGGASGLMGVVATSTQAHGGRVIGVIPEALVKKEVANTQCDELHVVADMHERKAMMAEQADVFMAIPGGIGTFEEFFEVWTWKQLGYHQKPIGLLNAHGYYAPLLTFMAQTVEHGFVSDWQMELIRVGESVTELMQRLVGDLPKQPG